MPDCVATGRSHGVGRRGRGREVGRGSGAPEDFYLKPPVVQLVWSWEHRHAAHCRAGQGKKSDIEVGKMILFSE